MRTKKRTAIRSCFGSRKLKRLALIAVAALPAGCNGSAPSVPAGVAVEGPPWLGFANDAQHAAQSTAQAQPLNAIHWRLPIDLVPMYKQGTLYEHYGSPVITPGNTVVVAVKTSAAGAYQIQARAGATGALVWQTSSDYTFPPHYWTPSYNTVLTASGRLYFPGAGGKLILSR